MLGSTSDEGERPIGQIELGRGLDTKEDGKDGQGQGRGLFLLNPEDFEQEQEQV